MPRGIRKSVNNKRGPVASFISRNLRNGTLKPDDPNDALSKVIAQFDSCVKEPVLIQWFREFWERYTESPAAEVSGAIVTSNLKKSDTVPEEQTSTVTFADLKVMRNILVAIGGRIPLAELFGILELMNLLGGHDRAAQVYRCLHELREEEQEDDFEVTPLSENGAFQREVGALD